MPAEERQKTLHGHDGLRIELDKDQIVPDNPGDGTPALVIIDYNGKRYCSTLAAAQGTGELLQDHGDGAYALTSQQLVWLDDVEAEVYAFLPGW